MRMKSILILSVALFVSMPVKASDEGDVELVALMQSLQYFTHKLSLSVDAKNQKLANFYAHEIEEVIEQIEKVESYDGHAVGKLVDFHLEKPFEALEKAIKSNNASDMKVKLDELIASCNKCHKATDHGYIVIKKNTNNPFMQSFKP